MTLIGHGAFSQMRSAGTAFQEGEVLYGRLRPYLNKVWKATFSGACSGELLVLRPTADLDADFLTYLLHGPDFLAFASRSVTGDRPRMDFAVMAEFPVPVPPPGIQSALVARINELFAEIDRGELALTQASEGAGTFPHALLRAAFSGDLTTDWRRTNHPAVSGQAYASSLAEARFALSGGRGRRSAQRSFSVEADTSSAYPELPDGWIWTRLGELISEGPTNGYSPKSTQQSSGTASLKLTATSGGRMRLDPDCVKVLDETIAIGSGLFLREADLLFQRGNTRELVGMAAVYNGPPNTFIYPDLMIRVRTLDAFLTRWLWRWANSPYGRAYMMSNAQGAAGSMPKISGSTVRNMPVPVGPPSEMAQVLDLLEQGLASIDLGRIDAEATRAASLRQTILAASLRGDLVA